MPARSARSEEAAAPEELQNGKGKTRILMSPGAAPRSARRNPSLGLALQFVCAMILPQVHLRKPCYDFSFL